MQFYPHLQARSLILTTFSCRFRYMDIAVCNGMRPFIESGVPRVVLSYDVACKYSVNFKKRVMPADESKTALLDNCPPQITFLVPKFHLEGHVKECADRYSFNFTEGVGRMSGELVETPWAALNRLQASTTTMAAGRRIDTLSHHFNHWNWNKITRMCTLM